MKKTICMILAAVMTFALVSCGYNAPTEPETQTATAPQTETVEPDDRIDLAAFISSFDTSGVPEEQVIYDSDSVTVTVTGMEYDPIEGASLLLTAVNSGEKDIVLQTASAAVNGYMVTVGFSTDVPAGGTADGRVVMPYSALALADIDRIATVEFALSVADSESYEVVASSEPAVIRTSAAEDYEPEYDESGQTVYDSDGVRIVLRGIDNRRVFSDSEVLIVYMYNGTDREISVQAEGITVNGYEFTSAMTTSVLPGKRAVDTVSFFDMDMEEYGIAQIDSVELSFKILDTASWETIAQTDIISADIN